MVLVNTMLVMSMINNTRVTIFVCDFGGRGGRTQTGRHTTPQTDAVSCGAVCVDLTTKILSSSFVVGLFLFNNSLLVHFPALLSFPLLHIYIFILSTESLVRTCIDSYIYTFIHSHTCAHKE